jgi:hypothetical protein
MKSCNVCAVTKPDEAFALSQSREDKLSNTCKECARARAKLWYRSNVEHKINAAIRYREEHPDMPKSPPTQKRKEEQRYQAIEEATTEYVLVRMTLTEKAFCEENGLKMGIRTEEYARFLVKDGIKRLKEREGKDEK